MSEGNNQTSLQATETLRSILERQLGRSVSYEEAVEAGESLLDFYELLATEDEYET